MASLFCSNLFQRRNSKNEEEIFSITFNPKSYDISKVKYFILRQCCGGQTTHDFKHLKAYGLSRFWWREKRCKKSGGRQWQTTSEEWVPRKLSWINIPTIVLEGGPLRREGVYLVANRKKDLEHGMQGACIEETLSCEIRDGESRIGSAWSQWVWYGNEMATFSPLTTKYIYSRSERKWNGVAIICRLQTGDGNFLNRV